MAYDSLTNRTDTQGLMPEESSNVWIRKVVEQSAALTRFRRVPVQRAQTRFPVLSALPTAYFVNGDTGLKQTTEVAWTNKYMNIEEIAVIIPVPDAVLDDADVNLWDEIQPLAVEAIGRAVDNAIFFGVNAPSSWPTNIAAAAIAAGNSVEYDEDAVGGVYTGLDLVTATVEEDGFDVTGWVAATRLRAALRAARATDGQRLDLGRTNGPITEFDGNPISYPMRGLWPTNRLAFGGDWDQFVLGVRQDITVKLLTEAVIQDNTGAIVYNLAQQDMSALRIVMRLGWQVANLINNDRPTESERYPVGALIDAVPVD